MRRLVSAAFPSLMLLAATCEACIARRIENFGQGRFRCGQPMRNDPMGLCVLAHSSQGKTMLRYNRYNQLAVASV